MNDFIGEITGTWKIGELLALFVLLAAEYGEEQKVTIDAGYNNVSLDLESSQN